MNKKGLSNVVTTVLITLLVAVAVSIVWLFVLPVLRNTGSSMKAGPVCLSNSVEVLSCLKVKDRENKEAYSVAFRPGFSEDLRLNSTRVSLEYADGTVSELTLNGDMASGQAISALILSDTDALRAKVSPMFILSDGSSKICGDYSSIACTVSNNPSNPGTLANSPGLGVGSGSVLDYTPSIANNVHSGNGRDNVNSDNGGSKVNSGNEVFVNYTLNVYSAVNCSDYYIRFENPVRSVSCINDDSGGGSRYTTQQINASTLVNLTLYSVQNGIPIFTHSVSANSIAGGYGYWSGCDSYPIGYNSSTSSKCFVNMTGNKSVNIMKADLGAAHNCDNGRVWGKDMKGIERCVYSCDAGMIWGRDMYGTERCVWDSAEAWALANQLLSKVQACANAGVKLNPPNNATEPTNYFCGNDNTYGTWQKSPKGWEWQTFSFLTTSGNYVIYMASIGELTGGAQIMCGHDIDAYTSFCIDDPIHYGGLCRLKDGFSCSRSLGFPDNFV